MTARSVLASALLGEDPPELPVAHLVLLAGLFGINPNRARVALSRMVASAEATTDGAGTYRLAGRLLERRDRQEDSLAGRTREWSGGWRMVVVTTSGSPAELRTDRRRRLVLARLAEQREGVWLRPDNIDLHPDPGADPDLAAYDVVPDDDPVALAAELWHLEGWAGRARVLVATLEALPARGPDDLASGFGLSAAVLRHLQADPLLPASTLRDSYGRWNERYRDVLRAWGRATRST
jgi:phenylacetic acid degradation operon negative regulatory protein